MVGEYGDRVAIGLDVRGRTLAARGWTRDGGDLFEVLERLNKAGCARYVVTDITQGRHHERARTSSCCARCVRRTDAPVIASGGVSTLDDLRALVDAGAVGVEGVIAGKALYAGAFTVARGASGAGGGGGVSIEKYGSGGPWEATFGYSRVVRGGSAGLHRRLHGDG